LKNVPPADIYFGREKEILKQRVDTKMKTLNERKRENQNIKILP